MHACDHALAALLAYLQEPGRVQMRCCVGDVVNGPGDPDRCAALLAAAGVVTVRGNHDRWLLTRAAFDMTHRLEDLAPETRDFLEARPASVVFDAADGIGVMLCHGLGENDMNAITADDYGYALEANDDLQRLLAAGRVGLVLKGHRHRHSIWRVGGMTIVDVGALTESAAPCAVVVDVRARTITPLRVSADGVSAAAPSSLDLDG